MWVHTQDKKTLVNVDSIRVVKNWGSKKHKACILGLKRGRTFWDSEVSLGEYASEEEAIVELEDIIRHRKDNQDEIYRMKGE